MANTVILLSVKRKMLQQEQTCLLILENILQTGMGSRVALMESLTGTENAKRLPHWMKGLICLSLAMPLLLQKIKCSYSHRGFPSFFIHTF